MWCKGRLLDLAITEQTHPNQIKSNEGFVNIMDNNIYYIMDKDGYTYQIRYLIYDTKFNPKNEATQAMTLILFKNYYLLCLERRHYF